MQGEDTEPAKRGVPLLLADGKATKFRLGDALGMTEGLPCAEAAMVYRAMEKEHEDDRLQLA